MARMIPSEIGYYEVKSGENEMFSALSNLGPSYYVFHSYRVRQIVNGRLNDGEADFLIFNPKYGCLFVEAKNGHVRRKEDGNWEYSSGKTMKDPFDQACSSMYSIIEKFNETFKDTIYENYIGRCKFLYCVWFPAYSKDQIESANFGPNVVKSLILPKEALKEPETYVEGIMKQIQKMHVVVKDPEIIINAKSYEHKLDEIESLDFLKHVLCPAFDIVPGIRKKYAEETYDRLLEEQCVVLDFLANQKSAAIAGSSGTGKTYVALERAKRLAAKGEKVLFLCYNKNLQSFLEKERHIDGVDFYTLDGFACSKCHTSVADYCKLKDVLESEIALDEFEYKHIIVDEGQDFGRNGIDDSHILEFLAEEYVNKSEGHSFFIFYDKNQLGNSDRIPSYLVNVDSKLTLYKNCRNTKNIAKTAFSLIETKPVVYDGAMEGEEARFIFYGDTDELEKKIDKVIEDIVKEAEFGRVLISCKGYESMSISDKLDDKQCYKSLSGRKTKVYTTSTFKGLEEDYVLLFDVDSKCFDKKDLSFYIGASRAKKKLIIFMKMNDAEINSVIENRFSKSFKKPDVRLRLALAMHGTYSK